MMPNLLQSFLRISIVFVLCGAVVYPMCPYEKMILAGEGKWKRCQKRDCKLPKVDIKKWIAYNQKLAADYLSQQVYYNNMEEIGRFAHELVNIDARDNEGQTLLVRAIHKHPAQVVRKLLCAGANPNVKSKRGGPLFEAVIRGNKYIVRDLLSAGANPNFQDPDCDMSMVKTCDSGYRARELTANSLDPKRGWTPLHVAVKCGREHIVCELVANGADPNIQDIRRWTPLKLAVKYNSTQIARELLQAHGDPNACVYYKENQMARRWGNRQCVVVFNSETYLSYTLLHEAVSLANVRMVRDLIQHGACIHVQDIKGDTPLHKAVKNRHADIVREVLQQAVYVDTINNDNKTPLHLARKEELTRDGFPRDPEIDLNIKGRSIVISLLYDARAHGNVPRGTSGLHVAVEKRNSGKAEAIIDNGADVNACDTNQDTPLHMALGAGLEFMAHRLIQRGADVNAPNATGNTPLRIAMNSCQGVLRHLVENGAYINTQGISSHMVPDVLQDIVNANIEPLPKNIYLLLGQWRTTSARQLMANDKHVREQGVGHALRICAHYVPRNDADRQYISELKRFIEEYKDDVNPAHIIHVVFDTGFLMEEQVSPSVLRWIHHYYPQTFFQHVDINGDRIMDKASRYPRCNTFIQQLLYEDLFYGRLKCSCMDVLHEAYKNNNMRLIRSWNRKIAQAAVLTNNGSFLSYYYLPEHHANRDVPGNRSFFGEVFAYEYRFIQEAVSSLLTTFSSGSGGYNKQSICKRSCNSPYSQQQMQFHEPAKVELSHDVATEIVYTYKDELC